MKQLLSLTLFFSICGNELSAQEKECLVKLDVIKGVYTGECASDKANGKGKSVGTDQYEGDFKDGYPDGRGMYTWNDGHYFIGYYKKGYKEGTGEMYYESTTGGDSVITGYWKKDKYIGIYEKEYIVISNTTSVNKIECNLTDKKGEDIFITVHQLTSSTSINSNSVIPFISNISNIMGTFYTKNQQILTNRSVSKIQQVTFPFRAIFYFNNGENAEILFNEKGSYDVYVDLL